MESREMTFGTSAVPAILSATRSLRPFLSRMGRDGMTYLQVKGPVYALYTHLLNPELGVVGPTDGRRAWESDHTGVEGVEPQQADGLLSHEPFVGRRRR